MYVLLSLVLNVMSEFVSERQLSWSAVVCGLDPLLPRRSAGAFVLVVVLVVLPRAVAPVLCVAVVVAFLRAPVIPSHGIYSIDIVR